MSYITYESNQVVYLYNGATFDTVVNFNAAIGDKWLELKNPTGAGCFNARSHNIVTDTGRIMINNVNLKKISTTCTYTVTEDNAVTTHTSNNVFIERLLGQSSLAFSNYGNMFRFHCYRGERTDEPSFGFICYEDNTFPLYNVSGSSCDNLTGLRDNYLSSSQIQIYPNPANEMVNFKYELSQDNTRFKLSVINSLGQLVNEVMLQHTQQPTGSQTAQIGTENLPEGVYILKLTSIETSQQSQSANDVVVKRFVISR